MISQRMNISVLCDPAWWHWTATLPFLALNLAGQAWAGWCAMGLCGLVAGYFWVRLKSCTPYPVQVRLAYLVVLGCGLLPGMNWFHWVPLVGTSAMVVAGYCPLLRLLSLAPWNRTAPLSFSQVRHVFLRVPCVGGLVYWNSDSSSKVTACCSISADDQPVTCSLPKTKVTVRSPRKERCANVY